MTRPYIIEKNTMNLLAQKHHAGIIKLYYTFHDEENLYFVLDFAPGGELLSLLHKMGTFNGDIFYLSFFDYVFLRTNFNGINFIRAFFI